MFQLGCCGTHCAARCGDTEGGAGGPERTLAEEVDCREKGGGAFLRTGTGGSTGANWRGGTGGTENTLEEDEEDGGGREDINDDESADGIAEGGDDPIESPGELELEGGGGALGPGRGSR